MDKKQPAWGYKKAGAYVWHRWYDTPSLEAVGNGASPKALFAEDMALGRQYMFKTRISTQRRASTTLRSRTWPVGDPGANDVGGLASPRPTHRRRAPSS